MTKKLLFLINPHAGKGEMRQNALDCIDLFVKSGYQVEVYTTQKSKDATEYVRKYGGKFDRIVCSGGDGTLNEVISGVIAGKHDVPIGYIPAGTVNDFASSLAIPKTPMQAAELCVSGVPFCVDVGRFGDRHFNYIAAFGAFTDVSYLTPQGNKNLLGRTAYILEGIKELPQIKPVKMTIITQDRVIHGEYIYGMVTNTISVGGMKGLTSDNVKMDDGLFEVVLVRPPKNVGEWQQAFAELSQPEHEWTYIMRFTTTKIRFVCDDPVPWTLDGEYGGTPVDVSVEVVHPGVNIMVSGIE